MTEQEYIDVSDLAKLRSAKAILSDITPANSKVIDLYDFSTIMEHLAIWEIELSEKINIKENG